MTSYNLSDIERTNLAPIIFGMVCILIVTAVIIFIIVCYLNSRIKLEDAIDDEPPVTTEVAKHESCK